MPNPKDGLSIRAASARGPVERPTPRRTGWARSWAIWLELRPDVAQRPPTSTIGFGRRASPRAASFPGRRARLRRGCRHLSPSVRRRRLLTACHCRPLTRRASTSLDAYPLLGHARRSCSITRTTRPGKSGAALASIARPLRERTAAQSRSHRSGALLSAETPPYCGRQHPES